MFRKLKEFFFGKPEPVFEAPYKVEAVTLPPPQVPDFAPVAEKVVILAHDPLIVVTEPVTQEVIPAKNPRKPRAPKVVVQPKEKAPKKKPVAAMTAKPKAKKS